MRTSPGPAIPYSGRVMSSLIPTSAQTPLTRKNIQANPLNEDDAEYKFKEISVEDNFTREKNLIGGLNLSVPLMTGETSAFIKFGGKFKLKNKNRNNEVMVYESEEDLYYAEFVDSGWSAKDFMDGRYDPLGSFMTLTRLNVSSTATGYSGRRISRRTWPTTRPGRTPTPAT